MTSATAAIGSTGSSSGSCRVSAGPEFSGWPGLYVAYVYLSVPPRISYALAHNLVPRRRSLSSGSVVEPSQRRRRKQVARTRLLHMLVRPEVLTAITVTAVLTAAR